MSWAIGTAHLWNDHRSLGHLGLIFRVECDGRLPGKTVVSSSGLSPDALALDTRCSIFIVDMGFYFDTTPRSFHTIFTPVEHWGDLTVITLLSGTLEWVCVRFLSTAIIKVKRWIARSIIDPGQ